jgi:anti-anti-sigma factor
MVDTPLIPPAEEPPGMAIDQATVGRRTVLGVSGEIDLSTATMLRAAIESALDRAPRELWIDLSEIEFMDSTGLHALLDARRHAVTHNCRLAVVCPAGSVRRLLEITGVDAAMTIYADRDAAHRHT